MPYIGLIITSIGFIVPSIIAWKKRKWFDAKASSVLTISSVLYHGTLHPLAHTFDYCIAHSVGILSIGRTIRRVFILKKWNEQWVFFGTLTSIGIYWFKSRCNFNVSSCMWHMLFHISSQITWSAHLLTT
jgi:presenilin-like A22 family membrane protease